MAAVGGGIDEPAVGRARRRAGCPPRGRRADEPAARRRRRTAPGGQGRRAARGRRWPWSSSARRLARQAGERAQPLRAVELGPRRAAARSGRPRLPGGAPVLAPEARGRGPVQPRPARGRARPRWSATGRPDVDPLEDEVRWVGGRAVGDGEHRRAPRTASAAASHRSPAASVVKNPAAGRDASWRRRSDRRRARSGRPGRRLRPVRPPAPSRRRSSARATAARRASTAKGRSAPTRTRPSGRGPVPLRWLRRAARTGVRSAVTVRAAGGRVVCLLQGSDDMARTIRARRVVVVLAIALIGAACSDDDEPNAAEDESAEQTGGEPTRRGPPRRGAGPRHAELRGEQRRAWLRRRRRGR